MEFEDQSSDLPPSKTSRKKQMHALQHLGTRLTGFSEAQLDKLPLTDQLRNAIREYRRLPNSHGARRRQLQFIGRLMRDYDLEEIALEIDNILNPPKTSGRDQHGLDAICEQILLEGDPAINEILQEHPQLSRQQLRRFHLDYRKAQQAEDNSACEVQKRALTGLLRELLT